MTVVSSLFWCISIWLLFVNGASIDNLPWSYDKVALWADFGTQNTSLLSEYQSQFVATHYNIVSIEKCLGSPQTTGIPTEESFYKVASSIRQYASTKEIKVLFYFATIGCYCDCYNITTAFCNNQSMQFKDDNGNIVGKAGHPQYDHTQQYVRDSWVNAVVSVMKTALDRGIIVNGIFADGTNARFSNVSAQRLKELNDAVLQLFDETRKAFADINDDLFLFANGISTYSEDISHQHNLYVMPHVDGMLAEHFGAFEEVTKPNAKINVTDLLFFYNVSKSMENNVYGANKSLLIKAWVGPETSPINGFGPSWPSSYNAATPKTYRELQNASAALVTFPLAVYLCGIYNKFMYFNYAWWYNVNQGYVPCPDDPSSCGCPLDWYKEFTNELGEPITSAIMTETKCNRSFQNANVYVDLDDSSSAIIQWL